LFSFDTLQRFCDLCSGLQSLVHCHGCFDLLHLGHVRHLQAAKRLGGLLVVTVTPDRLVNKGAGRPVFSEEYRAEMVAALECVDCVAVNCWATAAEAIWWLKPAIYCKGADSRFNETQGLRDEREAVESVGGRLEFTDELTFHSSDLIHLLRTPNDVYAEVAS
jgi:rfaE bifunctional protein nucleotidyltransferase chain/domain